MKQLNVYYQICLMYFYKPFMSPNFVINVIINFQFYGHLLTPRYYVTSLVYTLSNDTYKEIYIHFSI